MSKSILIFPAGMPKALEYFQKIQHESRKIIGGSSLPYDPSREKYPNWIQLPYVNSLNFNDELKKVLIDLDVGGIFTPNIVVWDHLNRVLKNLAPDVVLLNNSPVDDALSGYVSAQQQASEMKEYDLSLAGQISPQPLLTHIQVASILRHSNTIPGMCDNDKIYALFAIFRQTVKGDVVEIGSWWGKSAFILNRLAHLYDVGHLLCVDPWLNENLAQGEKMVDSSSAQVDAEEAFAIFEINLSPYSFNNVNYLRMPSVDGANSFKKNKCITTATFGTVEYCRKISVLHIDGNHSYESVKLDIESWFDFMLPGGWIIFDDYIWPYGNGPKLVGDEFLLQNIHRIDVAFVMGSALFIQLSLVDAG